MSYIQDGIELPFNPADTLTSSEAAKLRRLLVSICGQEYIAKVEATARANALEGGFTPEGYDEKRAPAPIVVDLLFALNPEFMC